jgi:hypothetical protein
LPIASPVLVTGIGPDLLEIFLPYCGNMICNVERRTL